MAYRIPDEIIEKIRHSIDIVDVVSEYVQLKKQGRNYFGLCPFHGENTPSFSVSPEKQIYHCFGCGRGGNVFTFLTEIEGYSFIEAAKTLAKRINIDLSDYRSEAPVSNRSKEITAMIEAHELLKKFYHHLLLNTKEGQEALDYLLSRGFTKETIEQFEIGYSLNSWDFITNYLSKKGFPLQLMEKAGLIAKRESDGSYFDRFRNRIMFPIKDHHGNTVAFSGRVLGTGEPKYLNSPESIIFNKGKILYNFHNARLHIRKNQTAVLFEGFADVISSVRSGIPHSIATMGTSLTEEHAKLIRRTVETVILCYDSDTAGVDATFRAAKLLTDAGCYVKVAVLPNGMDPDDYIRKFGESSFRNDVVGASISLMAFKWQYLRRGKNLQDEGERIRYIEEILQEISALENAIEKDHYVRQLAKEFSISLEVLKSQLQQLERAKQKKKDKDFFPRNNISRYPIFQQKLLPAYHKAERLLIAHMLRDREIAYKVQDALQGAFNIEEHRAIIAYLYAYYEEGHDPDISLFLSKLNDENLRRLVSEIAMIPINIDVSELEISDYIKQVLNYQKMLKIKEKETEKIEAERQNDHLKAAQIAMEIIKMKKALK
jgi:DNA primase